MKIISIEFDGAIFDCDTPCAIPGAIAALRRFIEQPDFCVTLVTSRNPIYVNNWLLGSGLSEEHIAKIDVAGEVPHSAHIHIRAPNDERTLTFNGEWGAYGATVLRESREPMPAWPAPAKTARVA